MVTQVRNPHGLTSIFDENHARATHAWFFRPPSPRIGDTYTDGLPIDCFYHADAWMSDAVNTQLEKAVVTQDGRVESVRLVAPINRYGGYLHGSPIVAMDRIDSSAESLANWERIVRLMDGAAEAELENELEMMGALQADLKSPGNLEPTLRAQVRMRVQVLQRRIDYLKRGHDWDGIFAFFMQESERSKDPLKSSWSRNSEMIAAGVQRELARAKAGDA